MKAMSLLPTQGSAVSWVWEETIGRSREGSWPLESWKDLRHDYLMLEMGD